MKIKNYLWLIMIAVLALTACKKNNPTNSTNTTGTTGTTGRIDVFAVANTNAPGISSIATVWRNDVATTLTTTNASGANSVAVQGGDVYIAGYNAPVSKYVACYWKNTTLVSLTDGTDYRAEATNIVVQGTDVYVAGVVSKTGALQNAVYWKNGVMTTLVATSTDATVDGLALQGSDVYVCGSYYSTADKRHIACYWKNGILTSFGDNGLNAIAHGIAVNGNDVYVTGFSTGSYNPITGSSPTSAIYWKNGVLTKLPTTESSSGANGVVISGTDVYICGGGGDDPGFVSKGMYWKNGGNVLVDGSVFVKSIAVLGTDLYLSYSNPGSTYPAIWKNGVIAQISQSQKASVRAIAVVQQ